MRTQSPRRGTARALAILAATGTALVALATPALAHITVTPGTAQAGSAAELTFRVPNEEAKASVTKLQMQVPVGHPIAQLLVKPVPGWTITIKSVTLARPVTTDDGSFSTAVSEVTWAGGAIAPGQFQDFSVSADPLPDGVTSVAFKVIQTYSNGDIVRWIDLPQAGQPAPDHPAPILALTPAGAAPATSGIAAPNATSPPGNSIPLSLGAAGLAAGLLGLAAGLAAWRRARQAVPGTRSRSSAADASTRSIQANEDADRETTSR